ncbi:hypothetical protein [Flavobacterium microcysteis]|uniref:Lipoprotein n=1 Tax=Flavobacterium microcysteis TaxID=2596891 RepID=A0A501Q8X1_9FLAO|nr:hypothetical protein [Flavobacterium microcysteis]TPD68547.1 hypothetical protein FJA49_10825 [Flavobacterium microcysteis]
MKKYILLPIIGLIASCCSTKNSQATASNSKKAKIESSCPEEGTCSFEILQNKSMNVKTDGIDKIYYELEENPDKVVFLYKYQKKIADKTLQDAGYSEEIVFEMNKDYTDFSFSDKRIQSTKMLFGVFCYCKGKAGNYRVTKGSLIKKGSDLQIDIPPIVDNQIITQIKISL